MTSLRCRLLLAFGGGLAILALAARAGEQGRGFAVVASSQSVAQLDQATQQNAALVEESAAAAESLREQSHQLAGVVGAFQVAGHAPVLTSVVAEGGWESF